MSKTKENSSFLLITDARNPIPGCSVIYQTFKDKFKVQSGGHLRNSKELFFTQIQFLSPLAKHMSTQTATVKEPIEAR